MKFIQLSNCGIIQPPCRTFITNHHSNSKCIHLLCTLYSIHCLFIKVIFPKRRNKIKDMTICILEIRSLFLHCTQKINPIVKALIRNQIKVEFFSQLRQNIKCVSFETSICKTIFIFSTQKTCISFGRKKIPQLIQFQVRCDFSRHMFSLQFNGNNSKRPWFVITMNRKIELSQRLSYI